MKKIIIMTLLGLSLIGCGQNEHSLINVGDNVIIIDGEYQGCTGKIKEIDSVNDNWYRLDMNNCLTEEYTSIINVNLEIIEKI